MNLSDENRALLRRTGSKVFHWLRAPSEAEAEASLNSLLDAARAEGRAEGFKAGERSLGYARRDYGGTAV